MKKIAIAAAMLGPLLLGSVSAKAATLTLDGGWSEFGFAGVGSAWSDTFDFVLAAPAYLRITDAYLSGDQFAITINGAPFTILTSNPGSTGDQANDNYESAATNPLWSSLTLLLDAGEYSVSGTVKKSPYGGGGGAIQLSSTPTAVAVPGPEAGAGLGALALGGMALYMKRRRKEETTAA